MHRSSGMALRESKTGAGLVVPFGRSPSVQERARRPRYKRTRVMFPHNVSLQCAFGHTSMGTSRRMVVSRQGDRQRHVHLQATSAGSTGTWQEPMPTDLTNDAAETSKTNRIARMTWSLLLPDAWLLLFSMGTLILSVVVTLGFPLALGDLFDCVRRHISESSSNTLLHPLPLWSTGIRTYIDIIKTAYITAPPEFHPILIRLCACLVFSSIGNATSSYLAGIVGERFGTRLRKKTMERMMRKGQDFFDGMSQGELISRLNADCTAVQTTMTEFLGQRGVRSVIEILCSVIIITIKNPLSAFVSLVVTPCITLAMRGIVKKSAALTIKRQEAAARSMKYAAERISNVQTVQLFGQEEKESREYKKHCEEEYSIAHQCAVFQGLVEGAGRFAVNMGALSLLAIGGVLVLSGKMQVGTLLAFQVYNFFLSIGLGSLSASLGDLGKVSGALERLEEIIQGDSKVIQHCEGISLENKSFMIDSHTSLDIRFENVWFKYPTSDEWILKGISFHAKPGTTLALVGPSGSGKSTIAALLLGLYSPQKGSIYIGNERLLSGNVEMIRKQIGTMFQQPGIMSGSIADQIRLGKDDASDKEIAVAAKLSHCNEFLKVISKNGLDYQVGERGKNLSGGQQQRVALARALVRQPNLLVLDEHSSALDANSEQYIDMTLNGLECTKVVIAHRLSTVRRADSILVMDHGDIVEQGSHAELYNKGGRYRSMVDISSNL